MKTVKCGANQIDLSLLESASCQMILSERLALFTTVYSRRPRRYLEIGTATGGSAAIVNTAFDSARCTDSRMVLIDPEPSIPTDTMARLQARASVIKGFSVPSLPKALTLSGEPFDLVLVDGDHSFKGALEDLRALPPFLADRALVLCHDAHFFYVENAINEALIQVGYTDCGFASDWSTPSDEIMEGRKVTWAGLRLLMFVRAHAKPAYQVRYTPTLKEVPTATPDPSRKLDAPKGSIIQFPTGLIGLENVKEYALLGDAKEAPFLRLQRLDQPGEGLVVVPPAAIVADYRPNITESDVTFLALKNPEDAMVLNIVTLHDGGQATVNLKGPIVLNCNTRIGKQVIPTNSTELPLKHPLPVGAN